MYKEIRLKNRSIGNNSPIYFIADIGANHDGDINRAFKLIELAKIAGADAAKFQNFQANKIVSKLGFEKLSKLSINLSGRNLYMRYIKMLVYLLSGLIN